MDSLRLRETFCLRCPVCRRSPRLRGSPESAAQKAASRPFLRLRKKRCCRCRPRQGPARGRAPMQRRRSGCRDVPHSPRRAHPHNIGCGPRFSFSRAPARRRPSEAAVSRCILGPAPQRGRRGKVPPHTIRRARERSLPLIPQLGKQNAALFPRKIPPPNIEPRRRARFRPYTPTERHEATAQKRQPPMFATTAATTFMTGSTRQASARPLSFAGQVPNRIKLSAQSIFLKDHFFII